MFGDIVEVRRATASPPDGERGARPCAAQRVADPSDLVFHREAAA